MPFDPSTARPDGFDPSTASLSTQASPIKGAMEFASSRDTGIDYATGVRNAMFRAGFSRMSNEAEKSKYLDRSVGTGNWGKDSFGAYFISPEGLPRIGQQSKVPVSIDEQTMSRYDIADIAGDMPALVGGIGAGMAASGLGVVPGMILSGAGAAGGKALDEIAKVLQGHSEQSPGELAGGIAKEGAMGMLGEGVTRALKPIGRFLFGPGASRMTPAKKELMESSLAQGFAPRPGQVTDAPILARWEGMVKTIFGDLNKQQNDAATEIALGKLNPGQSVSPAEAGEAIRKAIIGSRKQLAEEARSLYGSVDQLSGNRPFIPTSSLKNRAAEIFESFPKSSDGSPVMTSPETLRFLQEIQSLPDSMTASQMQRVRTTLREASALKNLTPDLSKAHARMLRDAADSTFDDASKSGDIERSVINRLRYADSVYKEGIKKFDNRLANAITRDPGKIGSIEPEMVVDTIIRPGMAGRIERIKNAVSPDAWAKVRSAHAEEITSSIVKSTEDPLAKVFDGKAFKDALDKYGASTLAAVHGKPWTDDAYRLANSLMLVQKSMKASGAIVAANVALHPIANLPKLVKLRAMSKLLQQPGTLKYLTEGIQAPKTKAGIEALTRVSAQATTIAEDETGSARFTVTSPQQVEQ